MKTAIQFIIFYLLLHLPISLIAQDYLFDYDSLSTEDGLANLYTKAIYKDTKGFIWLGTRYGLNRYDGYRFELFNTSNNNLYSDRFAIETIKEDTEGNLWLSYLSAPQNRSSYLIKAIDIFNPQTQQAVEIEEYFNGDLPFKISDLIIARIVDPLNRIWITTQQGELFVYEHKVFRKVYQIENGVVNTMVIDDNNHLWIGSNTTLIKVDYKTGQLINETTFEHNIHNIWCSTNNNIWLSTFFQGKNGIIINLFQKTDNQIFKPFQLYEKEKPFLLENRKTVDTYRLNNGFWIINRGQYIYFFNKKGHLIQTLPKIFNPYLKGHFSLPINFDDNLWFTSSNGIFKVQLKHSPFQSLLTKNNLEARGITEDNKGNIYLSQRELYRFNPTTKQLHQFKTLQGTFLLFWKDNMLWSDVYKRKTLLMGKKEDSDDFLSVQDTIERQALSYFSLDNRIELIGTSKGLVYLDLNNKIVTEVKFLPKFQAIQESEINQIFKNTQGIWLVTSKGLYLMNQQLQVIRIFNKSTTDLPFDDLRHIEENGDGTFWIATRGAGLIHWQPSFDKPPSYFKQYTTKEGLSNNYLYAVYKDDYGYLWLPSDKGLMCFNTQNNNIRTFLKKDGIPHNEFNRTSHYRAKDGTLYFGTLNGFCYFHPKNLINTINYKAPLQVNGLSILEGNNEVMTDRTVLLNQQKKIIIQTGDKFIELQFAMLDFDKKNKHRFQYKIEGYSRNWTTITDPLIQINSLPYGNYTLHIRGYHIQKGRSSEKLLIPIEVIRPFYLRWWFFLFIIITTYLGVHYYIKQNKYKLLTETNRLEELVRNRTAQIQKDKQTIEQQADKLKVLNKSQQQFFTNITHEFRTPLTLVIGPLQQLLKKHFPKKIKEQHQIMFKNAVHLQTLINQLLDLSKLENGQMHLETSQGDLSAFTNDLVSRFQTLTKEKNQIIHFYTSEKELETHFDKEKWSKIIYNLISNAIKFTPNNGSIQVDLVKLSNKSTSRQETIRLLVQDTGIGIEYKDINNIFNRFYQIDGSIKRTQDGTGIGLALVKELIELQGGQINVWSKVGQGTSFDVELPVLSQPILSTSDTQLTSTEKIAIPIFIKNSASTINIPTTTNDTSVLKILIIEDNLDMQQYIQNCLSLFNYKIITANDGEEGIQKALKDPPDLIISDIMMPRKDGYEVTKTIRQTVTTSHIPIILLTAKTSLENRLRGLKRGADAYLTKPFSPEELVMRVQKLIELRQLMQARYQQGINENIKPSPMLSEEDEFMKKLKSIILDNITNEALNSEWLAQQFLMSRTSFYLKVKALTNYTVGKFINIIRLQEAEKLIKKGNTNFASIAYLVGFSSPSQFSKVCKRIFGKTPSEYFQKFH